MSSLIPGALPSHPHLKGPLPCAGLSGSWSQDPASGEVIASGSCRAVFGLPADATFNFSDFHALIHPEDRQSVNEALASAIGTRVPHSVEYRITTPSGEERWISSHAELQRGATMVAGFAIDITNRRRAEEHQSILTGELAHRVKNALATVNGIVNLTLRDAPCLETARSLVSGRISSLGAAHDLLVHEADGEAEIADITHRAIAPFADAGGRRFLIEGPSVRLSAETTMAFAMALHELATNAVKHGALSVPDGCVTVRWAVENVGWPNEPWLSFRWTESGGPRVLPPSKLGFGTLMIEQVLSRRTKGSTKTDYTPEGVDFRFRAPLRV